FPRDHGAEVAQRRLCPIDRRQPVARLPVAQPHEIEPRPFERARVTAQGELSHALQDEQLDLGDVRQADERLGGLPVHHGTGTCSMTSLITMSTVTPWLAACGPSQMRWL